MNLFNRSHTRRVATPCAVVFVIATLLGWTIWPNAFFRSYWFGLVFWSQLSIGCLIVLLLQQLTGGQWGKVGAPLLQRGALALLPLLPLFIPAFLALPHIFSWTRIEVGISSQVLVNKQVWLNSTAFIIRSLVYLGCFVTLTLLWKKPIPPSPAGPALVLTIIMISLCSTDWMMSLQPTFYSSLYPFLYFSGAMVSTFALVAGTIAWLQIKEVLPSQPELLLDYGKLLFAAILLWGYIVFCQFIIIWTGNLPDEAEWYVIRSEPGWLWLTLLVIAGHFVIPFSILLSQKIKKNARQLLAVCLWLLIMHLLEVFWMMRPTPGESFQISVFDFLMPFLMGVIWSAFAFGGLDLPKMAAISSKEPHA
jgi:hypothetical protein